MTLPPFTSNAYEEALEALTKGAASLDAPTLILKLRKAFPDSDPRELNLAVETYISRHQAPEKLGEWAREGHFSVSLLQQASRASIAAYRATVFKGREHVLEIGTGTGSDTAALARAVGHVTSIEGDPIAADLARRNLTLLGISNVTVVVGSAEEVIPTLTGSFDGLFADPMRRTKGGDRVKSGEDYSPPLSFLLSLEIGSLRAIKISPGLFIEPCPKGWSRQFVGYGEECLEQTLWFGSSVPDSSVIVTDREVSWAPPTPPIPPTLASNLEGYLVEAHATLNRCKRVGEFFDQNRIHLIADDVAYGIAAAQPERSPLFTSYRIMESFAYSKKSLKAALTRLGWTNRTELKKRNFSGDIEQIRAELDLPKHSATGSFGVVLFFRYHDKPHVVVAERLYEK